MPGSVPFAHGIVAQDDAMPAGVDFQDVADAGKKLRMMRERFSVVIAGDKMNAAIEQPAIGVRPALVTETEIAQVINGVFRLNTGIPARDERFVHLRGIRKRASACVDDIGMPKMSVGCEENGHRLAVDVQKWS